MNISHKHKLIWLAPERTGTKITRQILWDFDFMVFDPISGTEKNLKETKHSHSNQISEIYDDYKVICNVRNPYDRVFSIFLMTAYENILIDKNSLLKIKSRFNEWVLSVFEPNKLFVKIQHDYAADNVNNDFLKKWTLNTKKPDFFVRMEYLSEDLQNLDLIKTSNEWTKNKIEYLLNNNSLKNKKIINFDEIYDFESAKRVFFFYKKVFGLISYDPFSFTKEKLSKSEKISFLHDIL